jgi:hypothetical protein
MATKQPRPKIVGNSAGMGNERRLEHNTEEIRFYRANEMPYGAFSNLYKRAIIFEERMYLFTRFSTRSPSSFAYRSISDTNTRALLPASAEPPGKAPILA